MKGRARGREGDRERERVSRATQGGDRNTIAGVVGMADELMNKWAGR